VVTGSGVEEAAAGEAEADLVRVLGEHLPHLVDGRLGMLAPDQRGESGDQRCSHRGAGQRAVAERIREVALVLRQ
jgi:hypothetical protein